MVTSKKFFDSLFGIACIRGIWASNQEVVLSYFHIESDSGLSHHISASAYRDQFSTRELVGARPFKFLLDRKKNSALVASASVPLSMVNKMDIYSYRGLPEDETGRPKISGGNVSVSANLYGLLQREASQGAWFNWLGTDLRMTACNGISTRLASFSQETIERHYRCSNGLFWPLLHRYPEFVAYDKTDYEHYLQVQQTAARVIIDSGRQEPINIHDYQLFGLPKLLREAGIRSSFFLHIPFPRTVVPRYAWALKYAVEGMLASEVIGLHIEAYRENLFSFVENLPDFVVDRKACTISRSHATLMRATSTCTRVVVSPIGTNAELWKQMSERQVILPPELSGKTIFLLIGRSDPAKGIPNTIRAWGIFQEHFEEAKDCVLLVISTPSREQVACFKRERHIIEFDIEAVQSQFPGSLIFRNVGLPVNELASYYRQTQVLLACSKAEREGWGLTAPEFVACQEPEKGAVIGMSPGVGANSRFGEFVVELDPEDPYQMAEQFAVLKNRIGTTDAIRCMNEMQTRIPTVDGWWRDMQLEYSQELDSAA